MRPRSVPASRRRPFAVRPPLETLEPRDLLATLVAVVDLGFDTADSRLAGMLAPGWSVVDGSSAVGGGNSGHGTQVAADVAQGIRDAWGVASVDPDVKVLPVKVGRDSTTVAAGIRWAVDRGASVINLSLVFADPAFDISQSIAYAADRNVVVVVPAGQNGLLKSDGTPDGIRDLSQRAIYPASFESGNLLVVTAANDGGLMSDANYGSTAVDVGVPVYPTSFTSGRAAGWVGVLAGLDPFRAPSATIDLVRKTAKPVAALQGKVAAGGVLNLGPYLSQASSQIAGVRRFDFGPTSSPVAAGAQAVGQSTAYAARVGYGWLAGQLIEADRGVGTDLTREFVATRDATFAVDLPNGTYDVTVVVGDLGPYPRDQQQIWLAGTLRDSINTAPGNVAWRTFRVDVTSSRLTLRIADGGGSDPVATLSGLQIAPVATTPRQFDFGTASSQVAAGYASVSPATTYSAVSGFGWVAGQVQAVDRGIGSALTRDLVYSEDASFAVDLPNGTYDVAITTGDTGAYVHDSQQVWLEGQLLGTISTAASQVVTQVYRVTVSDGQLLLRLADRSGVDWNATLIALSITPAPVSPPPTTPAPTPSPTPTPAPSPTPPAVNPPTTPAPKPTTPTPPSQGNAAQARLRARALAAARLRAALAARKARLSARR